MAQFCSSCAAKHGLKKSLPPFVCEGCENWIEHSSTWLNNIFGTKKINMDSFDYKCDLVLDLIAKNRLRFSDSDIQSQLKIHISDVNVILDRLLDDEFITSNQQSIASTFEAKGISRESRSVTGSVKYVTTFFITGKGKSFIESGGYSQVREDNQVEKKRSNFAHTKSKLELWISIIALILSALAILISIYYQPTS